MILCNETSLSFVTIGLFDRWETWIHPTIAVETYELIFVTEGQVHIREGEKVYHLEQGDLLLLDPFVEHGGTETSEGHTAFYWLHFHAENMGAFAFPKQSRPDFVRVLRVMKELMQCREQDQKTVAELILGRFLLEGVRPVVRKSKLAHEIAEYIRIHASSPLTVEEVATHFGYAPDHVSRVLRAEFGKSAKTVILEKRLALIESRLLNTNDTVKEIAAECGFEDENIFVKFFKYHERVTPTQFRNEFFGVHMNIK